MKNNYVKKKKNCTQFAQIFGALNREVSSRQRFPLREVPL
jgi:hypothetical protein